MFNLSGCFHHIKIISFIIFLRGIKKIERQLGWQERWFLKNTELVRNEMLSRTRGLKGTRVFAEE